MSGVRKMCEPCYHASLGLQAPLRCTDPRCDNFDKRAAPPAKRALKGLARPRRKRRS